MKQESALIPPFLKTAKLPDHSGALKEKKAPLSLQPEPAKLPNQSSKWCPHCYAETGKKVARRREYHLNGPLRISQCDQSLPEIRPRISSGHQWWNKGPVRWLIAPPDPPSEYPWFERITFATCDRKHGRERIFEDDGRRQFGRDRLLLIWIKARIFRTIDLIVPIR